MRRCFLLMALLGAIAPFSPVRGQVPPGAAELAAYRGLHAAAARGAVDDITELAQSGADLNARDGNGRTPLHVAAFQGHATAAGALIAAGADTRLLDHQDYDAVTIAAVRNDLPTLRALLSSGASASLVTSPYEGTALIAAAHLGNQEIVRELIRAEAPLDHINNLGWTALLEAIILGDGGSRHVETVRVLLEGGADPGLPDRQGVTPLAHAKARGHRDIVHLLEARAR